MPNLGGWEWLIILAIVVLVFGVGRIAKIGGELGGAIRQFREGLGGEKKDEPKKAEEPKKDEPAA
ncbi:MAG: twin-arginine translocase TatA/TatE family subunit [Anaerolineales bacterium]|nr:twin-arginine translocase TatA/TatE family subunit [Anaerolineales bacterium]